MRRRPHESRIAVPVVGGVATSFLIEPLVYPAIRMASRTEHAPSRPWLMQWREMLSGWTPEQIADVVLDPESGQTLRQCSPLAPVLTPQERWAALEEVERRPRSDADRA